MVTAVAVENTEDVIFLDLFIDMSVLHVDPPSWVSEVVPHIWVIAYLKSVQSLVFVCFVFSGWERNEPILITKLVEII